MHTNETARPALQVRDRIDTLIMGRAPAARHRVLRLLDPIAAAEHRGRYLPETAKAPAVAPTERVRAVRARIAGLIGNESEAQDLAA